MSIISESVLLEAVDRRTQDDQRGQSGDHDQVEEGIFEDLYVVV